MKAAASALLLALMSQDPVCDHGVRGSTSPVDLREVARLHAETARAFDSMSFARSGVFTLPPFDSRLPSCRGRTVRRVRVALLPPEMKPLYFASAGSAAPGDALLVATRARSLADVSVPADPELVERFGVRCSPTLVRPVGTTEVELVEGESP
jgi:hypothetical protein